MAPHGLEKARNCDVAFLHGGSLLSQAIRWWLNSPCCHQGTNGKQTHSNHVPSPSEDRSRLRQRMYSWFRRSTTASDEYLRDSASAATEHWRRRSSSTIKVPSACSKVSTDEDVTIPVPSSRM